MEYVIRGIRDQIRSTLEVEGGGPGPQGGGSVRRRSRSRGRSFHHDSVSADGRSFIGEGSLIIILARITGPA